MRSHVTLLQGKVVSGTECKNPQNVQVKVPKKGEEEKKKREGECSTHLPDLPEGGVDLQRFAQHLRSNVLHVVSAQVHLSQAGVAAQGVDQHGAPRAQAGLGEGQRLQDLEGPTGKSCRGRRGGYFKGAIGDIILLLTSLVLRCI